MRKLFAAAFLLLCASAAHAQSPYTVGPFNTSGNVYVCGSPAIGAAPCSNTVTIYANAALAPLINPFPISQGQAVTFFVTGGQYTIQMPAAGYSQTVVIGGGGSGPGTGQFNVMNYGAKGDAKSTNSCVFTATSATVTDATDSPFLPSDVGKIFSGVFNSADAFNASVGSQPTITTYNSASSVTLSKAARVGITGTGQCAWYTQSDTAAFVAAYNAAATAANQAYPLASSPTLGYVATVSVPPGGYAVNGAIFIQQTGISGTQGVSFTGNGSPIIYVTPDFVGASSASFPGALIEWSSVQNFVFQGIAVDGMSYTNTNMGASQNLIHIGNAQHFQVNHIFVTRFGSNNSSGGVLAFVTDQLFNTNELYVQNGPSGDAMTACLFKNDGGGDMVETFCSNHFINLTLNSGSGLRAAGSLGMTFRGYHGDECGANGLACVQVAGSVLNCLGCDAYNPGNGVASISIDGTSRFYGSNMNVSSYDGDAGNSCGFTISSGGSLMLADSDVAGNNTSAAICGPAGATYVSVGGNILYNQAVGVRTAVTAASQTTSSFGWSGGIIPKSTETHSPNTCYAATGTLVATQNLCTDLLDQNYQVLTIAATEGGNAPAATSCTVAPVVTISDGTRSSTLTLTTAKTSWVSNVDASSLNAIMASGATMTVSVGTFTCATPPVNLSVSYNLQSVLNQ